jgi:hypothetical protein
MASAFSKIPFCRNKILLLIFLFPHILYSQTISGKIENDSGGKIAIANVVIKDSVDSDRIRDFVIARNGEYSISLKGSYRIIIIEVSASKYIKQVFQIEDPSATQTYIHDFVLRKDSVKELKEVIITAKAKPVQIRGDTVKYNVSAFRDGSERKIQDLIKKLPGIDVNEKTGEIRYKGKTVETVKLEGDDLFGENYSIGTKNINVDMVEEVQAIENYHDNPLLKNIENGDKVALNLKLKKNKLDFSGNADIGAGVSQEGKLMSDVSANILGISKKYKSFGTFSYNNVGINNSPFDYFSYNPGAEQIKESDFLAKKIISENFFSNELDDSRANINNAWFCSYNNIFKVGNRLSIKTNLYYINDKITSEQLSENSNFINNQQFLTSDKYSIQKKPVQYRGDIEIKYNSSKKSLLEYRASISQENITTPANVLKNDTTNYQTVLKTKDFYFKQSLEFTQKVSERKALQVLFNHSTNDVPQNYFSSPAFNDSINYPANNQFSNFKKQVVDCQTIFLGSTAKTKYTFSIGGNIEKSLFQSELAGINSGISTVINGYSNDFAYQKNTLYTLGTYNFSFGKWRLSPSYSFKYVEQNLTDYLKNQNMKPGDFIFNPAFSITYKLNSVSGILGTLNSDQKTFSEEYLFTNPIYISNREAIKNVPNLQFQKNVSASLFYLINDLYKQFRFNAGILYTKSKGNYFSNIDVQENSTQIEYFFLAKPNDNLNANFLIEKYIPSFQSTVRLKSDYSVSNYKNIVNNSDLRNNKNQFFSTELFMKTAFDSKINFENVFRYKTNKSQSENSESFTNETVNNTFKIIAKPNKNLFILLSSDYFLPNTKKTNENYLFLDATLRFTPNSKKFELNVIAKNILNKTNFIQIQTTDYSTSSFQSNLLTRYFMLSISYSF